MAQNENANPTTLTRLRCSAYSILWISSIGLGFYFLYAPVLVLLIFNKKLYHKITDIIFASWESFNTALIQIIMGVKIYISGDYFNGDESSLMILNHRTRVDWNFFWAASLHGFFPQNPNTKIVLKKEIRKYPWIGWSLQCARHIFISRSWKSDEATMEDMLKFHSEIQVDGKYGRNFQVVLYPEGTNFTMKSKAKSDKFSIAHNLKPLKQLLQPRTLGFSFIAKTMRELNALDAIYDVTIAYTDNIPNSEIDIFNGIIPREVHFFVKKYNVRDVPTTLIGLEKFLLEVWREKDDLLQNFYNETKQFPAYNSRQQCPRSALPAMYMSMIAGLLLLATILRTILALNWTAFYAWTWIAFISLFMALISHKTDGLQSIEVELEKHGLFQVLKSFIFKKSVQKDQQHDKDD